MKDYKIQPKPTMYKHVLYRSRLEAKWAHFFNTTQMLAQYEPFQIGKRHPDFSIHCESAAYTTDTIIAEVKPSRMITDEFKIQMLEDYGSEKAHLLILDEYGPRFTHDGFLHIGIGSQYTGSEVVPGRFHAEFYSLEMKHLFDFGSRCNCFDGMISGGSDRKTFIHRDDAIGREQADILKYFWALAGEETMFLRPKAA